MVQEVSDGIFRIRFELPWDLDHVNVHLMRGPEGWIAVDTGLGLPQTRAAWENVVQELDAPLARIIVTHFHPDHVGCTTWVQQLTGAVVHQGELDHDVSRRVWGDPDWTTTLAAWYPSHGVPPELRDLVLDDAAFVRDAVLWEPNPELLRIGERIAAAGEEWEVLHVPGHADGHIALLGTRSRRLLSADLVLATITPNIGYHPESRPDPLGDYLESLQRVVELEPSLILPGHHDVIEDGSARAQAIAAHHGDRLVATRAALSAGPRSAYEVSRTLFGDDLSSHSKRFAVAETLSHLVRLEREQAVERAADRSVVHWRLA